MNPLSKPTKIEPMDGAERALSDLLGSARRPDAYAMAMLDLTNAQNFRCDFQTQNGVALTVLDLTVKAAALATGAAHPLNSLVENYEIHHFSSVDVGVSVASTSNFAPVVVLRDAQNLTLQSIHQQRVELAREAVENQEKRLEELAARTRFLPDALRRRLIGNWARRAQTRRQFSGTIQISAIELDDMEWYLPAHTGTSLLISCGGIRPRAIVVNGQIEARPTMNVAFMIDQRAVHPVRAMRVFRRFKRLMETPEKLV